MSLENQHIERKSLRLAIGKTADWNELVKHCVAFANAQGGRLLVGIEDGRKEAPTGQRVTVSQIEKLRSRIAELTVNVATTARIDHSAAIGGEFIEVAIAQSLSPASTTDGRYFLRVSDQSKPLVGEDIQRLLNERNAQPWETLTSLGVPKGNVDSEKLAAFAAEIRNSDRVKASVKEKSDSEVLDHYNLAIGRKLTNLGVLCVGRREDRVRLGVAPVVQFIKYDDTGRKVNKIVWDDHTLTPAELVEAVWREIPDFRENYELPDGLFRKQVPLYDSRVVRELLVNALVHRPYTQRGDIYLNLYPDRLEIVNPGLLPLGVTPQNILHQSIRRNNELARVFHDLKLMEREGSGYDLIYEVLLTQGRKPPELREGADRVEVTIYGRIMKPEAIDFLVKADQTFQLPQREKIALGILAQHEALTARELADILELSDIDKLSGWVGRPLKLNILRQTGRTKGTRYYVDPDILRTLEFPSQTTLTRIEPPRLRALIIEDLKRHPRSSLSEIHMRIGAEIPVRQIRGQIKTLVADKEIAPEGERRWRRYRGL